MKISVIGCGYLGAVHAAAMASLGHNVVGIERDVNKIEALSQGKAPFFEPDLPELLSAGVESGRLRFSSEVSDAQGAAVHFICVGTPQLPGSNAADLTFVHEALDKLLPYLTPGDIVAGKSTVPVGTAELLAERVSFCRATLVWNPEFLREGFAVKDTLEPDRLVVGAPENEEGARAVDVLKQVYSSAVSTDTPFIVTNLATAELVKVAANSFLATKISFINAMAEIAEKVGADVTQLADAIGHDVRIGRRFLGAGIGFGGGCLPKDIRAFTARAEELGLGNSVSFLKEIDSINLRRRTHAVNLTIGALGGEIKGKKITVLGAAFKPHSDDIRDSPGLDVAEQLHQLGARVVVTDPEALDNARRAKPDLEYETDRDTALTNADAVILVTEWDDYRRKLSPDYAGGLVTSRIIVDGRNCLDSALWRDAGWRYIGMGKP